METPGKKRKKEFIAAIWKSMTKTGGCCGSGKNCGCSSQPDKSKKKTETKEKVKNERG
ncbi:hypothetical protein HY768_03350 [candidate division TA06 bacterium]|uniref:Uncharacterized protein n=1 Tax=candidate division TA06 bacterium TaxID=2250710 RepID=A0A933I9C3_UNCT6|nr:hypothetical protein [candidate division TA06 bacterium]